MGTLLVTFKLYRVTKCRAVKCEWLVRLTGHYDGNSYWVMPMFPVGVKEEPGFSRHMTLWPTSDFDP